MIALGHSASGVYLGLAGGTIISAGLIAPAALVPFTLLGAIGLHYVGDWLPHGHYRFDLKNERNKSLIKLGLDLVLPLVLLLVLSWQKFGGWELALMVIALIGVHLPDVYENLVDMKVLPSGDFAKEHRAFHYDKLHGRWRDPSSPLPNHARTLSWLDVYQFALLGLSVYLLV